MFFWGRGNITIGEKPWQFEFHSRQRIEDPHGLRRYALIMIAYPVLYGLQILPLSVVRWLGFVQENHGDHKNHVPPGAVISVAVIYNLSGITNIVLFLFTRRGLLLFGDNTRQTVRFVESGASIRDRGDVDSIEGRRDEWQDYMSAYAS